jgi:Tol biopolymer transport system component
MAWGQAPPCQKQPQDLTWWRNEINKRNLNDGQTLTQFQAYLNQLRRYTPLFRSMRIDELADQLTIRDEAGPEALRRRAVTVLWLNIISGRLNRATEIRLEENDEPITVASFLNALTQSEADSPGLESLLAAADAVNAGEQISQSICARLIYRTDMAVRQSIWSENGFSDQIQSLAEVPAGVSSFSPDSSRLLIETPRSETRGGPLYMYDLETNQLLNLNEVVGLPSYTGVSSLQVSAWHYDNHQLLLVNEDDEVTIWLDLDSGQYTPLSLGQDTSQMTPPRDITLAPDGSGFTFITFDSQTKATNLHWYSLADHTTQLMVTLPIARGHLTAFSFSPTSQQAAFIVRQGERRHGRSQEIHIINLADNSTRVLLSGNLGSTQPVWSPNGQQLAFTRKSYDEPDQAGPHSTSNLGNIWIISTATGEATQLTFIDAIKRPPVWSPDGQYLAFVTAEGQIGMVSTAEPGRVWRIETDLIRPQFSPIIFVP